jgi:2,3-bisphosphoglycerate-dependent phosphoglycerate mutase
MMAGKLILTRHGESEFNAKSLWTGVWDVPLTAKGRRDASLTAAAIKTQHPTVAYTSKLSRAADTLKIILHDNHWKIPVHAAAALNERDYGELTGMNKWTVEKSFGVKQFNKWRRGWNEPVPGGETLKMVYERVVPYYEAHIRPQLQAGRSVIITAHGNSLRALMKHLDKDTVHEIEKVEMLFGDIVVYDMTAHGTVSSKRVTKIDTTPSPP